ncbi:MAG TPA: zf-TFIIB domain-containing protein [Archangium sp.]|uniref:TFIIB-type zinc ribbon-containing protein n=1 Tax=Archangium sp. TaxID=1872627 RepID=UPI002E2F135B|nr:zf-TFIIB domain-containing protein [Archangium sp.]HEX5749360.1 zf-TFIIB domain-containing protein [Archangium sp.]
MTPCPFCHHGTMRPTLLGGFLREECGTCRAVWFEEGSLARVVGAPALVVLVRKALKSLGECKHCQATLREAPSCPSCGEEASRCPQCGSGPLAVAKVAEVPVDVCTSCRGVGLDAGELELLLRMPKAAPDPWPPARGKGPPEPAPPEDSCAGCHRELKRAHAFAWEDKHWCGSCAPKGASPVEVALTPYDPQTDDSFLPPQVLTLRERNDKPAGPTRAEVESALVWFFSKLLG